MLERPSAPWVMTAAQPPSVEGERRSVMSEGMLEKCCEHLERSTYLIMCCWTPQKYRSDKAMVCPWNPSELTFFLCPVTAKPHEKVWHKGSWISRPSVSCRMEPQSPKRDKDSEPTSLPFFTQVASIMWAKGQLPVLRIWYKPDLIFFDHSSHTTCEYAIDVIADKRLCQNMSNSSNTAFGFDCRKLNLFSRCHPQHTITPPKGTLFEGAPNQTNRSNFIETILRQYKKSQAIDYFHWYFSIWYHIITGFSLVWLLCKSKNFNVIYQTSRFATTKPPQGLAKRPLLALLPPTPWVHHTCHQLCHGLIPFTTQQRLHLRICRSEGREMDAVSFLGRHWNSSFSYGILLSCTSALPPSNLLDVTFEEVNHGQKIANLRIMFGSAAMSN